MSEGPKAFVVGWPIEHSRSPLIHGYWLDRHKLAGSYAKLAIPAERIEEFLRAFAGQGFVGGNVTIPHKEAAFAIADVVDDSARAVGAANTVWMEGDKLVAANTDTHGFMAHLSVSAPDWRKAARPVTVLGAGGAARAIVHGLMSAGVPEIRIVNRTRRKADGLCAYFAPSASTLLRAWDWDRRSDALEDAGLLVNATSLGMVNSQPLDVDIQALPAKAVVADIVYAPLETDLLRRASGRGLTCVDGLGMLLHQAVPGFERWFGVRPEVTPELRQLIVNDLRSEKC